MPSRFSGASSFPLRLQVRLWQLDSLATSAPLSEKAAGVGKLEIDRHLRNSKKRVNGWVVFLALFSLLAVACGSLRKEEPSLEKIYLPPSSPAKGASSPPPSNNLPIPTPTVDCVNNLLFLADQTIPDGTEVEPGATLDKIWEVENNGSCNYDDRYRLKLIGGSDLGAKPEQALYPARSGTQFQIHIRFLAPSAAGDVRSAWQAFDPQGNPFGDPIYLEITVK